MRRILARAAAILFLALASCAPQTPRPLAEGPVLSADARVAVASVRGPSDTAGVDAAGLLRTALEHELARRGIAWTGTGGARYALDVEIRRYEAGNAFQRWLLPGYGATILAVQGLLRAPDGSPAGGLEHERGVYAGGAYTIGAWRSIFDSVATDIARDLDNRIRRRGFTVSPKAWSSRTHDIPVAAARHEYGEVVARDLRADRSRIGTRTAAFGVPMGDVFLARDVDDYLAEAVADQLRAAGHGVGVAGAPPVTVEISTFRVHTDTTPLYWDVVAEIAAEVRLGPATARVLSCRTVERTWVWPTDELVGSVLDRCIDDIMADLVDALPAR